MFQPQSTAEPASFDHFVLPLDQGWNFPETKERHWGHECQGCPWMTTKNSSSSRKQIPEPVKVKPGDPKRLEMAEPWAICQGKLLTGSATNLSERSVLQSTKMKSWRCPVLWHQILRCRLWSFPRWLWVLLWSCLSLLYSLSQCFRMVIYTLCYDMLEVCGLLFHLGIIGDNS